MAHKNGRRFSAYNAYLEVMTDAHVLRGLIDRGRAVGVTVRRGGRDENLTARGVVLSAGAFASPQLLMLSGVGPPAQLVKYGLPVHVDRPEVGENLQDHPVLGGTDTLRSAESPLNFTTAPPDAPEPRSRTTTTTSTRPMRT